MIRNGKEMSSLSDEKCKGNVEDEKKKKKKSGLQQIRKGKEEKSENGGTEGGLAVTGNKFICKQAMKYDMTKSRRNFASAARLWLLQRQPVAASKCRLVLSSSSLPRQCWQRDGAEH